MMGRDVTIVDQDEQSFRKLGSGFTGRTVAATGIDRDALLEAGIRDADAFAAVSSGDNSNIIAARVARETFSVPTVVARIYDPRRAEVYERLGIPTVATVAWTAGQVMRRIDTGTVTEDWRDATGSMTLAELPYHDSWIGRAVNDLTRGTGARVAFITRYGETQFPDETTLIQDGDIVHVLCPVGSKTAMTVRATEYGGSDE